MLKCSLPRVLVGKHNLTPLVRIDPDIFPAAFSDFYISVSRSRIVVEESTTNRNSSYLIVD
jgi:hypothetical protein